MVTETEPVGANLSHLLAIRGSTSTLSALPYIHRDGDDMTKNHDHKDSAHTQTTSDAFGTLSNSSLYSSVHSDLKEGGSQDDAATLSTAPSHNESPTDGIHDIDEISISSPHNALIAEREGPNEAGDLREDITRRPRIRTGTLGGKQTPVPMTVTDTDQDTSTLFSDMVEEDSQSNVFDYSEEPSEYVLPSTPKVGGFGVETTSIEPHKDGMRSAASERVNKASPFFQALDGGNAPLSPELGRTWGANFWCIIEQPNDRSFFANPETGECAWAVPTGTFVLPPRPEGQWWELYDDAKKLSYYYHTKRKETQWERPKGFIIPLAAIQGSTLGKRFSRLELKGQLMAGVGEEQDGDEMISDKGTRRRSQPLPPCHAPRLGKRDQSFSTTGRHLHRQKGSTPPPMDTLTDEDMWKQRRHSRSRIATGLSTIPSSTDLQAASRSRSSSKTSRKKQSGQRPHTSNGEAASFLAFRIRKQSFDLESLSSVEMQRPYRRERDPVKRRLRHAYQEASIINESPTPYSESVSYIDQPVIPQVGRKRSMSLDQGSAVPPVQPSRTFSYEAFAAQKYAVHRTGLFRRKCPINRMMRWQKEPLRSSLLPLGSSELRKDAVRIFQVILRYCGDRVNPVFWPEVPSSSHSASSSNRVCVRERKKQTGPTVLEEVKWMIERAISVEVLRDEMFAQIMKQITGNEGQVSLHKAWILLGIMLSFAVPSNDIRASLCSFLHQGGYTGKGQDIKVIAAYCLHTLLQQRSQTVRIVSLAEIEAAEVAPFHRCQLVQSPNEIRLQEASVLPEASLPKALTFLAEEMLKRDCLSTVGVFERPGDLELVHTLRSRIAQGSYTLEGLFRKEGPISRSEVEEEVLVLASTLKIWLQDLRKPLFAKTSYNDCLRASQNTVDLIEVCKKLDKIQCRILIYLITFLRLFIAPSVVAKTRVDVGSIARIFATVLFRPPRQAEEMPKGQIRLEELLIESLLRKMPSQLLECDFNPVIKTSEPSNPIESSVVNPQFLGIGVGGNGAGLAPRSRKASTSRSRDNV